MMSGHRDRASARQLLLGAAGWCVLALPQQGAAQSVQAVQSEAVPPGPTTAGTTPAGQSDADIVVTARKRDETLIAVPVTVTAVTAAILSNRGINNLEGIARTIPNLFIGTSSGSLQGGALGLRGISAGDGNPFGDQALAFNIDGVQIARSTPRQFQDFDVQQVEVLKGPQTLYFGKNSPGGIVVLHSGDPTDHLQAGVTTSYEFNAQEVRGEGYLAGPIAPGLGARVAVFGSRMRGWVKNITTPGTLYSPDHDHSPQGHEVGGRFTLKYDDNGPFTARLKFVYGHLSNDGNFSNTQRVYCPLGVGQLGGPDDCTADDRVVRASAGQRFATGGVNTVTGATILGDPLLPADGQPYTRITQYLSGLELGYKLSEYLTLSSATGFYQTSINTFDNVTATDASFPFNPAAGPAGAGGIIYAVQNLSIREVSEEVRLSSNFDGIFNFLVGGYYQNAKLNYVTTGTVNALNPINLYPPLNINQGSDAYSFFGSISLKPIPTLEISGGGRYSNESKNVSFIRVFPSTVSGQSFPAGYVIPTAVSSRSFHNFSPEVTVNWRPTQRLTIYGNYKQGFLSGGFNPSGTGTGVLLVPDRSYNQETIKGFEAGIKSQLLANRLRLNLAGYTYQISGLQVTATLPGTITQVINNAASARTKGVEADANYQTPVAGLSFRGSVAYSRVRYVDFTSSPCYAGQTISERCTINAAGAATQDLSGKPLVRSPEWGASIGSTYDLAMTGGSVLAFSVDANYSGGYFTDTLNSPGGYEPSYWLVDGSVRYKLADGLELAFAGRNLTNKYYFQRSGGNPLSGGPAGGLTGLRADQVAFVSRGRELTLRLKYSFR